MLYIILAILSSTSIFVSFKLFEKFSVKPFQAIVVNYFTAGLLGLLVFKGYESSFLVAWTFDWRLWIIAIGVLFFLNFLLIQYSTKYIGMTTTSVACKISVIIPIVFSLLFDNELINTGKIFGIILAVMAIVLLTIKKEDKKNTSSISRWLLVAMPLILFLGLGITDAMVKYVQQTHVSNYSATHLTSLFFTISFVGAFIWGLFKKHFFSSFRHIYTIVGGVFLGLVNFGSIFFLILSLKYAPFDDSLVFGMVNLGIILLSVLIGFLVFREHLFQINWIGVLMAFISFLLLSLNG
jgi:drug/metabolite transporter (DMT)-like permease